VALAVIPAGGRDGTSSHAQDSSASLCQAKLGATQASWELCAVGAHCATVYTHAKNRLFKGWVSCALVRFRSWSHDSPPDVSLSKTETNTSVDPYPPSPCHVLFARFCACAYHRSQALQAREQPDRQPVGPRGRTRPMYVWVSHVASCQGGL
jgi:hypothetical protein